MSYDVRLFEVEQDPANGTTVLPVQELTQMKRYLIQSYGFFDSKTFALATFKTFLERRQGYYVSVVRGTNNEYQFVVSRNEIGYYDRAVLIQFYVVIDRVELDYKLDELTYMREARL